MCLVPTQILLLAEHSCNSTVCSKIFNVSSYFIKVPAHAAIPPPIIPHQQSQKTCYGSFLMSRFLERVLREAQVHLLVLNYNSSSSPLLYIEAVIHFNGGRIIHMYNHHLQRVLKGTFVQ